MRSNGALAVGAGVPGYEHEVRTAAQLADRDRAASRSISRNPTSTARTCADAVDVG